jgi:methionyl-tRNA formyltransferase
MEIRIVLFSSYYYGFHILNTIKALEDELLSIKVVGVATDDPTKGWTSPSKRLWRYPHPEADEKLVADTAERLGVAVWRGRINTPEFMELFYTQWRPDLCYMGVFGQRIPEYIWSLPSLGFYNLHPCGGLNWPSQGGTSPIEELISLGQLQGSIAMHTIDNEFDKGELVAFSDFFPLTPQDNTLSVAKATSPLAASLIGWHIGRLLGVPVPFSVPRVIAEIPTSVVIPPNRGTERIQREMEP